MTRTKTLKHMSLFLTLALAVTFALGGMLTTQKANAKSKKMYVITKVVKKSEYKINGKKQSSKDTFKVKYNKKGLAKSVSGHILMNRIFAYNKNGTLKSASDKVAKQHFFYSTGKLKKTQFDLSSEYSRIKTDSKGRITKEEDIDLSNSECNTSILYKYNKKGQIIKRTFVTYYGKRKAKTENFKYDKNGNLKGKGIKNYYKKGMKRPYKRVEKNKNEKIEYTFKYKKVKVGKANEFLINEQQRFSPLGVQTEYSLFNPWN